MSDTKTVTITADSLRTVRHELEWMLDCLAEREREARNEGLQFVAAVLAERVKKIAAALQELYA